MWQVGKEEGRRIETARNERARERTDKEGTRLARGWNWRGWKMTARASVWYKREGGRGEGERGASVYLLSTCWKSEGFILQEFSVKTRETLGKDERRRQKSRERGRETVETKRARARGCQWRKKKKATKTWREEGEEEKIKEDGRREEERSSRRAGRINKRGAPPSHLRHLYFAAPRGRKSSSVSERGDTMRRAEVCEQKGRQGVPRVQDHGHLPRALVINPFSDIYVSDNDHRGERSRQIRGRRKTRE